MKMENELVFSKKWQVFADSLKVAEKFNISHKHILIKIENLTAENPSVKNSFLKDKYINERNREYPRYFMDRSGYMFLVMNISNKRANEMKWKFIEAFNEMERALLNQQNVSWIENRQLLKEERKEETNKIKEFVDYATTQWSKNAKFYYTNITKTTYKALELLNKNKTTPLRDNLELYDMLNLIIAENKVVECLENGMEKNLHYKEIYLLAKQELIKLFEFLPKIRN